MRQLRVWKNMRSLPSEKISAILTSYEQSLKEVAMVVWIFMSADYFKSLSLAQLADQFDLP